MTCCQSCKQIELNNKRLLANNKELQEKLRKANDYWRKEVEKIRQEGGLDRDEAFDKILSIKT